MRSPFILLPFVSLCACSFDPIMLGETGESATESSSTGPDETETETGDPIPDMGTDTDGSSVCSIEIESGLPLATSSRHAWGSLLMFGRGLEVLLFDGEDAQTIPSVPNTFKIWGSSTTEVFSSVYDFQQNIGRIAVWDGQNHNFVAEGEDVVPSVTESGEVWIAIRDCETCDADVLRWNGAAFEASPPVPLVGRIEGLVARDEDDTRWILNQQQELASQTADAAWIDHGLVPGLEPTSFVLALLPDAGGGLWLVTGDETVRASHRDAQGVWTHVDYAYASSKWLVQAVADQDRLYLFDYYDHSLHTWDGSGSLDSIGSLPNVEFVFGDGDRVVGLDVSEGQALIEISPLPQPISQTLWSEFGVPRSTIRSATTVSAAYELDRASLRRWNEGWKYLAHSGANTPSSGFSGLWAESDTVAWISEVSEVASPRTRLWRWQDEQLTELAHDIDPDVAIHELWGTSSSRLFGRGVDPNDANQASIWAYDGAAWSALPMPAPDFTPGFMTGTEQLLTVHGWDSRGFAWDGQAWTPLPDLPKDWLQEQEFAWSGGMLFARLLSGDIGAEDSFYVLDGDAWVPVDQRWLDAPPTALSSISPDRNGGLWALARPSEAQRLWHFDGVEWSAVEPADLELVDGEIIGVPEGMIIHGDWVTQQFRWDCDG